MHVVLLHSNGTCNVINIIQKCPIEATKVLLSYFVFWTVHFQYGRQAFHSYHITTRTYIHDNILTDQYNGLVTLKDFELPDDGLD